MGLPKICYYKRIVTIYDVTISGLKCIAEIGKLQGPSIYCYYMRIVTISGVTIYGLHCTYIAKSVLMKHNTRDHIGVNNRIHPAESRD